MRILLALAALAASIATPAAAVLRVDINSGIQQPMPIAVPAFATPNVAQTAAGATDVLGSQVAEVIANDLKSSGLFRPIDRAAYTTTVSFNAVAAPAFPSWRTINAQALVTGFVQAQGDGSVTVGCYLYDVFSEEGLTREGFTTTANDWRRAAHKCADAVYSRLTGESGYFDSRIVYVSETGPKTKRLKRLAIMDQDGANHRFLTNGQNLVLTPRFAPGSQTITYMNFKDNQPRVYVYNIGTGRQELVSSGGSMTFAPRFAPDGQSILLTKSQNGNADIYRIDIATKRETRLTTSPGIDTGGSYSPDGSKIVFESDRSGTQQLYVMNADGSNQQRISFGSGRYGTPVWSPRGDLIAFTKIGGGEFRIGIIRPDGGGERLLTNKWSDEGPTWSPNGRVIMFFRTAKSSRGGSGGGVDLWSVDLTGINEQRLKTPLDGSDPAWSPLLK